MCGQDDERDLALGMGGIMLQSTEWSGNHFNQFGVCTPCAKNRSLDEAKFFSNMQQEGGPHLIDMAVEAKVFNF